ncbi:regulator of G-protein signaling 20-like [Daphnia carinata]|uniref:regulator of G-protein signaling 20-like n=1 Tax=Daphnia carinata TaxID=120202 RepID=UPI00257C1D64|nr:regulator of G-protein signaling 20-like [Daphnia carinata]
MTGEEKTAVGKATPDYHESQQTAKQDRREETSPWNMASKTEAFATGESYGECLASTTTTTMSSAEQVTVTSTKTMGAMDTPDLAAVSSATQPTPSSPSTTVSTIAGGHVTSSVTQATPLVTSGSDNSFDGSKTVSAPQQDLPCAKSSPKKAINELSPKSGGTNQNSSGSRGSSKAMRNNASSAGSKETLKQRKSTEGSTGSNPIHHIAASGSPARHGTSEGGSAGATTATETGRRTSTGATNNSSSRNTTKPCCFCWCCCYRCTCLSSRNQEEELSKSKDITSRDSWSNDPEVTPSVEEIRCWGDSFDRLMKSPMGRAVFREFLKCEYSEENILFWLACEDLKKDNNPEVVEEKARLIYEDYISILSPKEVSLDSRVREIVNRNMVDPTPHTFDEAQLQIYTLMHRDSYPRFVNSAYYKKLAQLSSTSRKESSA